MTRFTTYAGALLAVALLPAVSGTAQAAEAPPQYDIELLVFRNLVQNDGGEVWRDNYVDWFDADQNAARTAPATTRVEWLGESARRLNRQEATLRASAQYRPIAHFAWRQAVLDRDRSRPVTLPASGRQSGNAWVDGSARVAVERYLHLYLDLQLHMPRAAGTIDSEPAYREPRFKLSERRRMRSSELHYFDNPRFGVLAMITPYEAPAAEPQTSPAPVPTP